jgi:hypothetical protein
MRPSVLSSPSSAISSPAGSSRSQPVSPWIAAMSTSQAGLDASVPAVLPSLSTSSTSAASVVTRPKSNSVVIANVDTKRQVLRVVCWLQ